MKADHVMTDLETMDTIASSVILSIGAVVFDATGLTASTFHTIVNYQSCIDAGLTVSKSTEAFWERQRIENPAAYKTVELSKAGEGEDLVIALKNFSDWIKDTSFDTKLWGNGADFDNPILNYAYTKVGLPIPWKPYNGRCYRTIKTIFKGVQMVRKGTYHNALDDARNQAVHLIDTAAAFGFPLN